jgi:hypothetical protein
MLRKVLFFGRGVRRWLLVVEAEGLQCSVLDEGQRWGVSDNSVLGGWRS